MKKRRVRQYVLLLIFALLVLVSCTRGKESSTAKASTREKVTIGFSLATDTFIIERWNKDIKIFTNEAKQLGAQVILQLSAGGTHEQISQIQYLLDQGIDILVVIAHDTEMLAGVIGTVNQKKIPVIAYDRLIQGVPITAYVSFDNREVGRLFGRALIEKVPQGNYLIVNGSVNDNNSYEVNAGLYEILNPFVQSKQIRVVEEIWLNEWDFDEAKEKIGAVLERTTNIDAISAGNDQIASAAIQLLAERRMAGSVAVVGQDADLISCQSVVEGLQLMTVYKPIDRLAIRAARLAVDLVEGRMSQPDMYRDNNSDEPIPFFMEVPYAVYKHNMDDTIIRDGFHSAADVYRNLNIEKY